MKILVADDERDMVHILQEFLEAKGFEIDAAFDGKEALEMIKTDDYDFVFVDVNMPEKTGPELVRYMKQNNIRAKAIMITGYEDINEFYSKNIGVDEYLRKPLKLREVERIVNG